MDYRFRHSLTKQNEKMEMTKDKRWKIKTQGGIRWVLHPSQYPVFEVKVNYNN